MLNRKMLTYKFFVLFTNLMYNFTSIILLINFICVIVFSYGFIFRRKYEINLEGHLLDPILNLANRVITAIFRNQILPHIEDRAFKMFREIFKEWNKKIPRPNRKQFIEEWFYNNMFNMQFLN